MHLNPETMISVTTPNDAIQMPLFELIAAISMGLGENGISINFEDNRQPEDDPLCPPRDKSSDLVCQAIDDMLSAASTEQVEQVLHAEPKNDEIQGRRKLALQHLQRLTRQQLSTRQLEKLVTELQHRDRLRERRESARQEILQLMEEMNVDRIEMLHRRVLDTVAGTPQ